MKAFKITFDHIDRRFLDRHRIYPAPIGTQHEGHKFAFQAGQHASRASGHVVFDDQNVVGGRADVELWFPLG